MHSVQLKTTGRCNSSARKQYNDSFTNTEKHVIFKIPIFTESMLGFKSYSEQYYEYYDTVLKNTSNNNQNKQQQYCNKVHCL